MTRNRLVEDGYRQLANLSSTAMKGLIRVKFVNLQVIQIRFKNYKDSYFWFRCLYGSEYLSLFLLFHFLFHPDNSEEKIIVNFL